MKRLTLALVALVIGGWFALRPSEIPAPTTHPPTAAAEGANPPPLPALPPTEWQPELVARLDPVPPEQRHDQPSPSELGFAPRATETGWVIEPPKPPPKPNETGYFRPEPPQPDDFERAPDDTANQGAPPLSATELEDHGHTEGGTEEEQHRDGERVTWAPGIPRTQYDTSPPSDLTRATKSLPGLPENHPLFAETRALVEPVPRWRGEGTDTRLR